MVGAAQEKPSSELSWGPRTSVPVRARLCRTSANNLFQQRPSGTAEHMSDTQVRIIPKIRARWHTPVVLASRAAETGGLQV